jgi:hypothetical protein
MCVSHFRNFVYDFTAITKYKITALLHSWMCTYVLFSMWSLALSTHFSHLCGKRSVAALYSSLLNVKRQWQQCWYHLLIQMFSLKMFCYTCKHPVITWGEIWKVGCANTSQPQRCIRYCTSWWRWGVALSWSKMTLCTSSSSCLWQTAGLALTALCNFLPRWQLGMPFSIL